MENVTDAKFKELLSRLQKELLKQKGFKKSGSNFRQFLPDGTCKIINFQKSMFNGNGICSFTINIGLYFQEDIGNPNIRFKEYDCQVRCRAPDISERYPGVDHWWTISENTDGELLYEELFALLKEDILPWLDQFSCRRDVIRAGQAGKLRNMIWGNVYA